MPVATTVKLTVVPGSTVRPAGWLVIEGAPLTCVVALANLGLRAATGDTISNIDLSVASLMRETRNAPADEIMTVITMMGDTVVMVALALAMLVWLVWHKAYRAAWAAGRVSTKAIHSPSTESSASAVLQDTHFLSVPRQNRSNVPSGFCRGTSQLANFSAGTEMSMPFSCASNKACSAT